MDQAEETYLKSIYFDANHPASFTGAKKLSEFIKQENKYPNLSTYKIRKWLNRQQVDYIFRPQKKLMKRRRVLVAHKFQQLDLDTAVMRKYQKENKPYQYFFVAIDILSRYAWASPLTSLTGKELSQKLEPVLKQVKVRKIRSDLGSENKTQFMRELMKKYQVNHFFALNTETKANYAERLLLTIKRRLYKALFHQGNHRWVELLPKIISSYNNTPHRGLGGLTPTQALSTDNVTLRTKQYAPKPLNTEKVPPLNKPWEFKVDQAVSLSAIRHKFARGWEQSYTGELFYITDRIRRQGHNIYSVKSHANIAIKGWFYAREMTSVHFDDSSEYKVERILGKKKIRGVTYLKVRWSMWGPEYDSLIRETDIKDKYVHEGSSDT